VESFKIKKIILSGGGTGGSVVPLLGIAEELNNSKKQNIQYDFLWLGTKNGPEKEMVENEKIKFFAIANGKWRRYFSWLNLSDIIKIIVGFFQSFYIIIKYRPDLIMSAGSFVSVPVVWAGWVLKIPALIHQQDVVPGLANKLMAPFCQVVTVTFEKSLKDYGKKAVLVGNILRDEFYNYRVGKSEARQKMGLHNKLPVVLILGGGTGSLFINNIVAETALDLIKFCQIILITGPLKNEQFNFPESNIKVFNFLNTEGIIKVFYASDIIITRCGMGALTELSYFGKPTILIPMPDSHQEKNADVFKDKKAALVVSQKNLNKENFVLILKNLLNNKEEQVELSRNIKNVIKIDREKHILNIINQLL
jgi:UDP-N-acetylglucosamine--N-acetylmuramyl-(pentapeptide) pyrophosphoryl-undecaprenol N-acetylglucosamine transferase